MKKLFLAALIALSAVANLQAQTTTVTTTTVAPTTDLVASQPEGGLQYLVDATRDPGQGQTCLLYTSPSPRDATLSRMPSSA